MSLTAGFLGGLTLSLTFFTYIKRVRTLTVLRVKVTLCCLSSGLSAIKLRRKYSFTISLLRLCCICLCFVKLAHVQAINLVYAAKDHSNARSGIPMGRAERVFIGEDIS